MPMNPTVVLEIAVVIWTAMTFGLLVNVTREDRRLNLPRHIRMHNVRSVLIATTIGTVVSGSATFLLVVFAAARH